MSGKILTIFRLYLKKSFQFAMVKQTINTMKQPELGLKIQEWRKAKGLTQEELVERCNINVRTIQRIEAGEVTPRSHTIKAIMEVLDVSHFEALDYIPKQEEMNFSTSSKRIFLLSAISGIIYFLVSIVEIFWDWVLYTGGSSAIPYYYIPLKICVLVVFALFFYGYFHLGKQIDSKPIQIGVVTLIFITAVIITVDIFFGVHFVGLAKLYGILKIIITGVSLIPLSIGVILAKNKLDPIFIVWGIIGLLTSLFLVTFFFAFIGLIFITIFDILAIYLLFLFYTQKKYYKKQKYDNSSLLLS